MPYVRAWERLPDAIKRITAGGRPKDEAQTELCQAIADGTVKSRSKLEKHTTRGLSFPKIISVRSDDAIRIRQVL
jgi:hypothetical protein